MVRAFISYIPHLSLYLSLSLSRSISPLLSIVHVAYLSLPFSFFLIFLSRTCVEAASTVWPLPPWRNPTCAWGQERAVVDSLGPWSFSQFQHRMWPTGALEAPASCRHFSSISAPSNHHFHWNWCHLNQHPMIFKIVPLSSDESLPLESGSLFPPWCSTSWEHWSKRPNKRIAQIWKPNRARSTLHQTNHSI